MQDKIIDKIFQKLAVNNPNPKTELYYCNHFTLLVATILSAQTTDVAVNKITTTLFTTITTPEQMLTFGVDKLKACIKTIGLYNNKAANIIALCQILIEKYNSQVPDQFEQLRKLPGIGSKTANVILNCAFSKPVIAVDTHVRRVSQRLGFTNSRNPDKISVELMQIIPSKWLLNAHHWLILHGRYICKALNPNCVKCCINEYCPYYKTKLN